VTPVSRLVRPLDGGVVRIGDESLIVNADWAFTSYIGSDSPPCRTVFLRLLFRDLQAIDNSSWRIERGIIMAREDALLRIHKQLVAQRDALRRWLLEDLHAAQIHNEGVGDEGDAALDGTQTEINSQLAALESRELTQIELAIQQIRDGHYGVCEGCGERISLVRLKALPFTTTCIACQRREEGRDRNQPSEDEDTNWEAAFRYQGSAKDREITINDLELDL
jgi:DnaK suppressor protein